MKLNCPVCNLGLTDTLSCENEHHFHKEDGVIKLMLPTFEKMLSEWLVSFEDFRSPHLKKLDFNRLPESGVLIDKHIWNARIEDIKIIDENIDASYQTALEIGSWNGWLANHLTTKGLNVTAIDYFIHELDGMKAKKHYSAPNWTSIQMDLENLSVFNGQFDLIILNRCLAYFTNPLKYLLNIQKLVKPDGKIIITGLNVKNHQKVELEFIKLSQNFKKCYNKELQFKPSKNYIDFNDLDEFKKVGVKIKRYPGFKNTINSILFKDKNVPYFGVYKKK